MKKMLLALTLFGLVGCGMTPNEIREKPTQSFISNKTQDQVVECLVSHLDERTFNGVRSNTVTKPIHNGVSLSPLAGNFEFVDITREEQGVKVIYYGEGTVRPLMPDKRKNEVIEDINSCL